MNKRIITILISIGVLLLLPLIAMQFTNQVNWSPFDFLIMGTLLFIAGLMGDLVWRKVKKMEYRILLFLAILLILFLIWAELAVGIFGTPFAGS